MRQESGLLENRGAERSSVGHAIPSPGRTLRVIVQQPALPGYRLPFFAELARRPGLDVHVVYGEIPDLSNATAAGFSADFVPTSSMPLLRNRVWWHVPQWEYAAAGACDVLMLSWNLNCASLVPALVRARREGVATLLWGHGSSQRETAWRLRARRLVTRLATGVMFYGERAARSFIEAGYAADRVFVSSNALDQTPIQAARSAWASAPDRLSQFRRQEGLNGPTILFVSRLQASRGLELLVDAVSMLLPSYPALTAVIIGSGPDEARLRSCIAARGLEKHFRLPGAIYESHELAPWYLSSDVFCCPQGLGLGLLQAFGYGLPVIAGDRLEAHGPELEGLKHGRNGLLFPHGDAAAMADGLHRIFHDQLFARRASLEAHRTALEEFTIERMVSQVESAIRACVPDSGMTQGGFGSVGNGESFAGLPTRAVA